MNQVATIPEIVYGVREKFNSIAGNNEQFDREAGFAIQILQGNDYAMRIALDNKQSVINAVTNIAAVGISLNPAKRQAYLVPRDGKICLDISFMGLLDLAIQSGSVMWGQAELVYEADKFELRGFDQPPMHNRDPFSKDRGALIGAYVVVKTHAGDYLTTPMSIDDIYDIRDRSSAWKAWISKKARCPWVTDEGEMVKKTVIKRAYKLWPKTDRLDQAVHYLNNEGGEGLADLTQSQGESQSFRSSPTMGAMAALSIDEQTSLRDLAAEAEALFGAEDGGVAVAFDLIEAQNLESDQKVALWSVLPSVIRTALKKEGEARRKAIASE